MDSLIINEKINSNEKKIKMELPLTKIKENMKNDNIFNENLQKTLVKSNIKDLLGNETNKEYSLFEDLYKSDDEDNIKDQNDIYQIKGRKSIGELDNEMDEFHGLEKDEEINKTIENWKYEKILLNNNIIDYNCK